jgi:uncharacterized protein with GYD domain
MKTLARSLVALALLSAGAVVGASWGHDAHGAPAPEAASGNVLLTVFLKHDQSKNLAEIAARLEETQFWQHFPPEGIEVASWYVVMGIGQVVTLEVPPDRLRDVNLAIEKRAWGAFRTEFYPTYDFRELWKLNARKAGRKL